MRRGLGRRAIAGLLLARAPAAASLTGSAVAATKVDSQTAKAKLLGPLWLSLQWIGDGSFNSMGKAQVENRNGTLHLSGRQDGSGDSAGDWCDDCGDRGAVRAGGACARG